MKYLFTVVLVLVSSNVFAQEHPGTKRFLKLAAARGYDKQQTACYVKYMQENSYQNSSGAWVVQANRLSADLPRLCGIVR